MTTPLDPNPAPDPEPDHRPLPEADDVDLAASAVIDGVDPHLDVAAGEVAGPAPEVVEARVAQLRPAVEALTQPIQQPDTRVRDEQVRRAISTRSVAEAGAADHDLVGERSQPRAPAARRWLAAAAAIAVLVVGALAVARLASGHGPRAQTASRADTAAGSTTQPAAQPNAAAGGVAAAGPSSIDQLPDLGSATDADGLVVLVHQHQANGRTGPASGPTTTTVAGPSAGAASSGAGTAEDDATCVTTVQATHPGLGPLDLVARASLAGQTVEVLVFQAGSAPASAARVLAVRPSDCQVLVDRPA